MVKITCSVLSGVRKDHNDWSPHPEKHALETYYNKNKKDFKENYTFTLQGVNMKVTKISDKSKSEVNFSFS